MNLADFALMSTVVNRAIEYFKQNILNIFFPELPGDPVLLPDGGISPALKRKSLRNGILLLLSAGLGILIVVGAGPAANAFLDSPVYGGMSPWVGQILTGIAVGGGANAVNWLGSFSRGGKTSPSSGSLAATMSTDRGTVEVQTANRVQ